VNRLAQSVVGYIRKHDLLRPGDRVGIAVSGGADSVALLRMLLDLRQEIGIVISVVHLNHKLRGADSDGDEEFVRELAAAHRLEFICESRNVRAYAAEKRLSLEAAAREVRYEFFSGLLRNRAWDKIATAHTLDDQAETVLLKLARGAGTRGLAGIYPMVAISQNHAGEQSISGARSGWLIRPLLGAEGKELAAYLGEIGQSWREDASNRDLRHTRNRVRHGIIPRLVRHVNPAVRETLAENAEIARAEEEYWTEEVSRLLPQVWNRTESGGVLNNKRMGGTRLALQRRLVRAATQSLGLNLEFRHVEDVLGLEVERRTALPEGWVALRRKSDIRFELAATQEKRSDYEYELPIPGSVTVIEAGLVLETAVPGQIGSESYNPEHLLDSKFVERGLTVRNWRAGERFWPLHTKEPKRIKELLQNRHITGDEKKICPVVASGDEIVWVRGLGVGREFQGKNGAGVLIRELPLPRQT
jgi:tRNA(Ile)-lysidine synthase